MTEPNPEIIINEKVDHGNYTTPVDPKLLLPMLDLKKDLSIYGSQEAFDKAVQDMLSRDYVPFTTESSKGDFALFLIQKHTNRRKILLLLGDDDELPSEPVGTLGTYVNMKNPEPEQD